jgi:uncharacterized protein YqjF (DUF2071 family)
LGDSPVSDAERLRLRLRPPGWPLMRQRWQDLAFLHWSVRPETLAPILPPALELDLWEGKAYLGLVPFSIRGTRLPFLPPVPILSSFHELNVRTYVHRRGRDPGVWFFSLDAANRTAVWGARAVYKLPYFHASIALARGADGRTSFSSRRAPGGQPRFECAYEPVTPPAPVAPGSLAFFLIERYLLYSWDGRRLRKARVWHHPYPVSEARVADLAEDVAAAAGVPLDPGSAVLAHHSEGVDVRIYPPRLVRQRLAEPPPDFSLPELIQTCPTA